MESQDHHQEYELEAALLETKRDMAEGRYVSESVEKHIRRITDEI